MNIIDRVTELRVRARQHGDYRRVSESSGVSYHWLQQFAIGKIKNPTIENISKLETFFSHEQGDCSR